MGREIEKESRGGTVNGPQPPSMKQRFSVYTCHTLGMRIIVRDPRARIFLHSSSSLKAKRETDTRWKSWTSAISFLRHDRFLEHKKSTSYGDIFLSIIYFTLIYLASASDKVRCFYHLLSFQNRIKKLLNYNYL